LIQTREKNVFNIFVLDFKDIASVLKIKHVLKGWPGLEHKSSVYFLKRNHLLKAGKSYKHSESFV